MTKNTNSYRGRRTARGRGAFLYDDYRNNHVICSGSDSALKAFVEQRYGGLQHKLKNAHSSNSEDALTWSCFDALRHVSVRHRKVALAEIWELAFSECAIPAGVENGEIHIGKTYGSKNERTEVDLSIESPGGLDEANSRSVDFYFILLDIAPIDALSSLNRGVTRAEAKEAKASGFGNVFKTVLRAVLADRVL